MLITVPLDEAGKPLKCQRYVVPQWHLLAKNGTSMLEAYGEAEGDEDVRLEECRDGWSYQMTERTSTVISDVRQLAEVYMLFCDVV